MPNNTDKYKKGKTFVYRHPSGDRSDYIRILDESEKEFKILAITETHKPKYVISATVRYEPKSERFYQVYSEKFLSYRFNRKLQTIVKSNYK